jgi:hypothetical protein
MKQILFLFIFITIISNCYSQKVLDSIVNKGTAALGIDVLVNIFYIEDVKVASDAEALLTGSNGVYDIYIRKNQTLEEAKIAICHELIHIYQYESKSLIKKGNGMVLWNGVSYSYNDIPYEDREWEAEAFSNGMKLFKKIR